MLRLRHPWSDGTTHLLFDPLELLERLAVLIPRPRINLILRHLHLPTGLPTPCPGRAPPLLGACSFGQNPDIAAFNSYG